MRFRSHVIAGLAASVLITAIAATISIAALHVTGRSAERIARQFADNMARVQDLRVKSESLVAASRGFLLTGETAQEARFSSSEIEFERSLQRLALRGLQAHTAVEIEAIAEVADSYLRAVRHAGHQRAETGDPRTIVAYFDDQLRPRKDAFERAVKSFVHEERVVFDLAIHRALHLASTAQATVIATSAIGVALSILLACLVIRRLGQQLRQVAAATEQANRAAAARKEILAIVSHDLRNPLSAISLGAGLLAESSVCSDTEQRTIERIRSASTRMEHLIDDLVESSELDASGLVLDRVPCSVRRLLDTAAELFQQRADARHVRLTLACEDDLHASLDRERVHRILANLIGNALKFSRAGDAITVTGSRIPTGVRIEVADTGPGIAHDQLPHLFEPYWQGDRRRDKGSVGLGLHICRKLVDAHGGQIGVTSELGRGSTFWFELPAS
jgi:signal transduction histidine kinase